MADKLKQAELKAALARAETELQETLERVQMLREWITATRKLCGKRVPADLEQVPAGVIAIPRRRTKTADLANRVVEVLSAAGKPLHVREIVAELGKRGSPVTARNPVATVAVALIRRPEQFVKVSPNTFELAKHIEVNVAN